jgi:hypothetical protein
MSRTQNTKWYRIKAKINVNAQIGECGREPRQAQNPVAVKEKQKHVFINEVSSPSPPSIIPVA